MYCTECIIGIIQNAGTPSRLRFARTRRDEGGIEPPVLSYILQRPIRSVQYCESTPRSQVNLSHDSSRSRRAVGWACELPLGSATEAHSLDQEDQEAPFVASKYCEYILYRMYYRYPTERRNSLSAPLRPYSG